MAAAEEATQRLSWEQRILGMPVSVHPVEPVETAQGPLPDTALTDGALTDAAAAPGKLVELAGTRVAGWTGGPGWFLADRHHGFAVAVTPKEMAVPRPWRPIRVAGRWQQDEWGNTWFQVERWSLLAG
jgi:hypothetical protein